MRDLSQNPGPRDGKNGQRTHDPRHDESPQKGGYRDYDPDHDEFDEDFADPDSRFLDDGSDEFGEEDDDYDPDFEDGFSDEDDDEFLFEEHADLETRARVRRGANPPLSRKRILRRARALRNLVPESNVVPLLTGDRDKVHRKARVAKYLGRSERRNGSETRSSRRQ